MPRALQAVIVLVLLLLVPAEETFTAPTALEPQVVDEGPLAFDAERAAPCLAEARSVMSEHDEGEYLVWLTPDRNYYERHLVAPDGTRRYRIDDQIPGEQPVPGVEASYETWRTDLDEEDLEEGIRVLATD